MAWRVAARSAHAETVAATLGGPVIWQRGALVLTFLSTTAAADGLRIEDAVHLALQNNERARKAPLRVEVAEGQLDRARDAFFPPSSAPASAPTSRIQVPGRRAR